MPKIKLSMLLSITVLVGLVTYGLQGFSAQPVVRLTTNPPINQLIPFEAEAPRPQSPVELTLQVADKAGQPLKNANVHLQILTPPKSPWFTTDFPIVEGTKLLDMEVPVSDAGDGTAIKGTLQLQQMLPIRGAYQLIAAVKPTTANAFTPFQQTLKLSVPENPVKYYSFAILAAILLMVGLGGGLIIGRRQIVQPAEIAPQAVRMLLSGATLVAIAALLVVNVSAELNESSQAHQHPGGDGHHAELNAPALLQSQGLRLELTGDSHAVVGEPAHLSVQVIDAITRQPATDVLLKVKATQLENHWVSFAYNGAPDVKGQLTWQSQFFDGSPHRVEVEALPRSNSPRQFKPLRVSREIEVEGVAPPLSVRLISLTYLISILLVGLALGLWLRQRGRHSRDPLAL